MSCDQTILRSESKRLDAWLTDWNSVWNSIARYSIVRSEFGYPKKVVATQRRFDEGKLECARLDTLACIEVGCKPDAFGRPVHYLQLERPEETQIAFLQKRESLERVAA